MAILTSMTVAAAMVLPPAAGHLHHGAAHPHLHHGAVHPHRVPGTLELPMPPVIIDPGLAIEAQRPPTPEVMLTFSGEHESSSDTGYRLSSADRPPHWTPVPHGPIQLEVWLPEGIVVDFLEVRMDSEPLEPHPLGDGLYQLPCPAPGKHLVQVRYLWNNRWSAYSPPLRFEIRLPKRPRIIAIAALGDDPLPVERTGVAKIRSGSATLRLADVDAATQVVAYLDGQRVTTGETGDPCCRTVRLEGHITPGVHTLTVRTVHGPADCSLTSKPSNEVMLHYDDEDVYLLRPGRGCENRVQCPEIERRPVEGPKTSSAAPRRVDGHSSTRTISAHPIASGLSSRWRLANSRRSGLTGDEDKTPAAAAPVALVAYETADEDATSPSAEEEPAEEEPTEEEPAEEEPAEEEPAEEEPAEEEPAEEESSEEELCEEEPAEDESSEEEPCEEESAEEERPAPLLTRSRNLHDRAKRYRDLLKATAEEMRALADAVATTAAAAKAAADAATEEADASPSDATAASREARAAQSLAAKAAQSVGVADAAVANAGHRVARAGIFAVEVEQHLVIPDRSAAEAANKKLTAETAALERASNQIAEHLNLIAEQRRAAEEHLRRAEKARDAVVRNHGRHTAGEGAAEGWQRAAGEAEASADARIAIAQANERIHRARATSAPPSPFYFAAPAHFPLREFGLQGEVLDREGAVIHEDMKFSFERDGSYTLEFTIRTPAVPTTVRLQLLVQPAPGAPWYTVTLPPMRFRPAEGEYGPQRRASADPRECVVFYNHVCRGRSEILRRCYPQMSGEATIRRKGTARFGFGYEIMSRPVQL